MKDEVKKDEVKAAEVAAPVLAEPAVDESPAEAVTPVPVNPRPNPPKILVIHLYNGVKLDIEHCTFSAFELLTASDMLKQHAANLIKQASG